MGSKFKDLAERTGVTLGLAFFSALLTAGAFDVNNVLDVSMWGKVIFAVVVAAITLITSAIKNAVIPTLPAVYDFGLRIGLTFVQAFLAALLLSVTELSGFANLDTLQAAALAGVAAALSWAKGFITTVVSQNSTASLLPPKDDPTVPGKIAVIAA